MNTPIKVQSVAGHSVSIFKHTPTGERFLLIDGDMRHCVPVGIASLAAGKDAWMRQVQVKCSGCRVPHKISEMEQGYTDLACGECMEKAYAEIEALNE